MKNCLRNQTMIFDVRCRLLFPQEQNITIAGSIEKEKEQEGRNWEEVASGWLDAEKMVGKKNKKMKAGSYSLGCINIRCSVSSTRKTGFYWICVQIILDRLFGIFSCDIWSSLSEMILLFISDLDYRCLRRDERSGQLDLFKQNFNPNVFSFLLRVSMSDLQMAERLFS